MPIDISGFEVPETPYREFHGLDRASELMMQNRRFQYQMQRQKEEDEWRKLHLIQDLTDLSKHQTGSDIANAIGNQQASSVLQKYTATAGNMSPAELQAKVSQEMGGVLNGMDSTKNELETSDKQLAVIKQQFPNLDIPSLAKDYRRDILNRRLKNDKEFVNPMEVQPSEFAIGDPEFLSHYVTGDKNLRTYFQNPQGMDEMSVYKGSPNSYTKYTAKVPSYKKPNFDQSQLHGGFMTTHDEPQLQFKSSTLPSDTLPSSNGKPFEMMDKDVFDNMAGQEKLELIANTRKQFPTYSQMNPTEKEYAQRHVMLETAKAFDQTNFHPTEVHTPSAAMLKFYAGESGGKGGGEVSIKDVYGDVKSLMDNDVSEGHDYTRVSKLDASAQPVIVKLAKEVAEKKGESQEGINQSNIYLKYNKDGHPAIFKIKGEHPSHDDEEVIPLNYTGTNVPAQSGIKPKQLVTKIGNEQSHYSIKGHDYSEKQLLDMGYKLDDIKQYKK